MTNTETKEPPAKEEGQKSPSKAAPRTRGPNTKDLAAKLEAQAEVNARLLAKLEELEAQIAHGEVPSPPVVEHAIARNDDGEDIAETAAYGDYALRVNGDIRHVIKAGNLTHSNDHIAWWDDSQKILEWKDAAAAGAHVAGVNRLLREAKRKPSQVKYADHPLDDIPPDAPPRPLMGKAGFKTERLVRWLEKYAWNEFVATYGVTSSEKIKVPEHRSEWNNEEQKYDKILVGHHMKYPARCTTVLTEKPRRRALGLDYDESVPDTEPEGTYETTFVPIEPSYR